MIYLTARSNLETIAASDLNVGRCRQLIEFMKLSIEGQGHFFTIYIFQVVYVLCFSRPRYQVSVYRTIGPLVLKCTLNACQYVDLDMDILRHVD